MVIAIGSEVRRQLREHSRIRILHLAFHLFHITIDPDKTKSATIRTVINHQRPDITAHAKKIEVAHDSDNFKPPVTALDHFANRLSEADDIRHPLIDY